MLNLVTKTNFAPDTADLTVDESQAAARAVVNLFARWDVPDAVACDILGGISARTYARWKLGQVGRVDRDLGTRLSLLLGIHKALRYMFRDPQRGYDWVSRPNAMFSGQTPLQIMAQGNIFALARVRGFLDAERGAW